MIHATDGFGLKGWMVTVLHLEGAELFTFALVHQFSQSGAGVYKGNTTYLREWTGWSDPTCRKHLAALVAKGLICEVRGRENNSPFCHYKLAPDFYEKYPQIIYGSPERNLPGTQKNLEKSTRKNFTGEYNCSKIVQGNNNFPPTPQEVADYCRSRGFADPEGFADMFVELCTNAGWRRANGKGDPITNWKNYIVSSWERNHKNKSYPRAVTTPNQQVNRNSLNSILR